MVTIKDVARLAGVSTATVSRTLAEPDKVAEATREKVMAVVRDTGYVTNTLASNFRRRRTNTVVVLVPDIANSFFSNIIQGIERVASAHNYRVLLGDSHNDIEREHAYGELVSQRQADGIICLGRHIPFPYHKGRKTADPEWPPFAMACEYGGVIPVPTVCIDNVKAATDAMVHLLDLGHRQIGFINGPEESPLCRDRLAGYRHALHSANLDFRSDWVRVGDFSMDSGYREMRALLESAQRPTAVFCGNDEMAIGAIQACRDGQLQVPRDMSVIGFDDIAFAEYYSPPLTTIRQPRNDIGEQVMRLMLSILNGEENDAPRIVLPHELVVRASTDVCPLELREALFSSAALA